GAGSRRLTVWRHELPLADRQWRWEERAHVERRLAFESVYARQGGQNVGLVYRIRQNVVVTIEHVVVNSISGAHDKTAGAERSPGQPDARSEILIVRVVDRVRCTTTGEDRIVHLIHEVLVMIESPATGIIVIERLPTSRALVPRAAILPAE